jgi:hypothetical protein
MQDLPLHRSQIAAHRMAAVWMAANVIASCKHVHVALAVSLKALPSAQYSWGTAACKTSDTTSNTAWSLTWLMLLMSCPLICPSHSRGWSAASRVVSSSGITGTLQQQQQQQQQRQQGAAGLHITLQREVKAWGNAGAGCIESIESGTGCSLDRSCHSR